MCPPALQTFTILAVLQLLNCDLFRCRLLGQYVDTPHQHNASDHCDAGSMLLQDKLPASTTQVTVLSYPMLMCSVLVCFLATIKLFGILLMAI